MNRIERIRNFAIIAHIDHGKSTLADRILEMTGSVDKRKMKEQFLDQLDVERERGITVKSAAVNIEYKSKSGEIYELNLIDTPGHVDFTYEVSRALKACEGAILLVDSTQGVQAQTVANLKLARDNDLYIIPTITKTDLESSDIENTLLEMEEFLNLDTDNAVLVSGKTGYGVNDLLESIINEIPVPKGDSSKPLKALIFDANYDQYKGVVVYIRVFDGEIKNGDEITFLSSGLSYTVNSVGYLKPLPAEKGILKAGEVGFFTASIYDIQHTKIGDTVTLKNNPCNEAVPGYVEPKPYVFCGIYPMDSSEYENLKKAIEKLKLNDSSIWVEPDSSTAMGFGFRAGFLGLLHMEVSLERLSKEFDMGIISTFPNVSYRAVMNNGEEIMVDDPSKLPDKSKVKYYEEPYILATIITPADYMGPIMEFMNEKRATYKTMNNIDTRHVLMEYEMPLSEMVYNFYDKLKAKSKGYASFDYKIIGYRKSNITRVDILINKEKVDALSFIVPEDDLYRRAKEVVEKLKDSIPKHLFEIPIQAFANNRVIARSTVKALRKDVLAKCYGGDVTRKMKLLEKQKQGKKKMKQLGKVSLPQEVFLSVLRIGRE